MPEPKSAVRSSWGLLHTTTVLPSAFMAIDGSRCAPVVKVLTRKSVPTFSPAELNRCP
jgi:hypothetical protein